MTPAEVAALFRVDPKTVTRWAEAGKLTSLRTLGGHRRYRAEEVHRLLSAAGAMPSGEVETVTSGGVGTLHPDAAEVPSAEPVSAVAADVPVGVGRVPVVPEPTTTSAQTPALAAVPEGLPGTLDPVSEPGGVGLSSSALSSAPTRANGEI